jgi:ComF family protein
MPASHLQRALTWRQQKRSQYIEFMNVLSRLTAIGQRVPGVCQVCARWPSRPICHSCTEKFAPARHRCATCARPLHTAHPQCGACLSDRQPVALTTCLAAVDYAFPWDQIIARFKFRQEPALAQSLAALMLATPSLSQLLQDCDCIVPIPVSTARLAERGYNQAWELTKALRQQVGAGSAPGWAQALQRTGEAPDQHHLPAQQRLGNVRHAFRVTPSDAPRLTGAHALLIDDVCTTGATLRAAALALRQAGASRVSAAVIARAE